MKSENNVIKQDNINLLVETNGLKSKLKILENVNNDLSEKLSNLEGGNESLTRTQVNSNNYHSNNTYQNNFSNQNSRFTLAIDCYLWDSPDFIKAKSIKMYNAGDEGRIINKVKEGVYYVEINGNRGYIHEFTVAKFR